VRLQLLAAGGGIGLVAEGLAAARAAVDDLVAGTVLDSSVSNPESPKMLSLEPPSRVSAWPPP
jgi:hypothetical protein